MKIKYLIFFILFIIAVTAHSEDSTGDNGTEFFFDAITFKSDSIRDGRLDAYTTIPYQLLEFKKIGEKYIGSYNIMIQIIDSNKNVIEEKKYSSNIVEKDFSVTQGSKANFESQQTIFYLNTGKYKIEALLIDENSKKEYKKTRTINILNYNSYPFSTSGILLLSSIEEQDKRFVITPFLSENIALLTDGFFVFFEVYNKNKSIDSADFVLEFTDKKGKPIFTSKRIRRALPDSVNGIYLKIPAQKDFNSDEYTLSVYSLKKDAPENPSGNDFLSVAQRSVSVSLFLVDRIYKNLDLAINQLRYVANSSEIDNISAGETSEEKRKRFDEFWKKLDPTPGTERNEALEEYYQRIETANKLYKSYNAGWATDKGMVYIIYGNPVSTQQTTSNSMGTGVMQGVSNTRMFERWTFADGRVIVFVDNTGFGDYRLYSPYIITDKYSYHRY